MLFDAIVATCCYVVLCVAMCRYAIVAMVATVAVAACTRESR